MAYVKGVWVDEILDGSAEYTIGGVSGQTISLDTSILQAGTDFNAAKMNNIENGIETLDINKYDSTDLASQTQAEAGTDNTTLMTPLRTEQAITALTPSNQVGVPVTLSGASTTISGLDINSDGGFYEIILSNVVPSGASPNIYMYINGDTTATNYYSGESRNGINSNNNASILLIFGTGKSKLTANMSINGDKVLANSIGCSYGATNMYNSEYTWEHKSTQSNVTSITFALSSGTFSSGTVEIYKRR